MDTCVGQFALLHHTLRDLGVKESPEKLVEPTQCINCLGTQIDARNMTISVLPDRIEEIRNEVNLLTFHTHITRKQLQSILGKLNFVCACVRSGRLFMCRLLNMLRQMKGKKKVELSQEAMKDLQWWHRFLPQYSDSSILWMQYFKTLDSVIATDASLTGLGGVSGTEYFHMDIPGWMYELELNIAHFELYALIVGLKLWSPKLKGKRIVCNVDNMAVCSMVNTGFSRDEHLQDGMREVAFVAATGSFEIYLKYVNTKSNVLPDLLSRWSQHPKHVEKFHSLTHNKGYVCMDVSDKLIKLSHQW